MKHSLCFTLAFTFSVMVGCAQDKPQTYSALISKGWKLCLNKKFEASAALYEQAFKIRKQVPLRDRYNAACIYSLANNADAAYKHLFIAVNELKWYDTNHLKNDADLLNIRKDKRWQQLIDLMQSTKQAIEKDYDKALVTMLDKIYFDDQSTRRQIRTMEKKHGRNSPEMKAFWQTILKKDSLNLIKVSRILDTQGWPGKQKIGQRGTTTLFLVIQHSNLKTQQKYLPMITKAMKHGNLPKRQYAMFYDRLVLGQGKRQLYGTQLAMSKESNKPYVLPLEDPKNVDKRRAAMGLNTMQENLNRWNLIWDVEAYLKMLPKYEAKEKELNKKSDK